MAHAPIPEPIPDESAPERDPTPERPTLSERVAHIESVLGLDQHRSV